MKLIPMRKGDIEERIVKQISDKLTREGYVYKKSNNWFIYNKGDFEYIIYILLHSRRGHYAIELFLFIRQKKVEQILRKIIGSTTNITMGNTLGVIYNTSDGKQVKHNLMEILLLEEADIDAAAETIEKLYESIMKRYFKKYENLESINNIMNNPPFDYNPANVGGMFDERCMRGLIIAKLINNPKYDQLVEKYDEAIKETMNQESIDNYNEVKNYLVYNW
jgi:hypothetical protein